MTTTTLPSLEEFFKQNEQAILNDFFQFLKFESVSSEEQYLPEMEKCLSWLESTIQEIGMTTERWPTSGHPTLFAEWNAGPEQPTLLIYNHYDVQPVDPLEEWKTPPFEPTKSGEEIYARGAQDNKGQCYYVLLALTALLKRDGTLPINIKWIIEGEEEIGSPGLYGLLKEKSDRLKADYLAIVDVGMSAPDKPAVSLGVRGMVTFDLTLTGSNTDLHSGSHGGLAINPIHSLTQLLSHARGDGGQITIPGFYDDVKELSDNERQQLDLDFDAQEYEKMFAAEPYGGEDDRTPLESNWTRPTLEINGIWGGYTGSGFKTVIPAKAHAKISCRLVPDQSPKEIAKLVVDYFTAHCPQGMQIEIEPHEGGGPAVRSDIHSEIVQATAKAYEEVNGTGCGFILEGGSIPIVADLAKASGTEVVLMGYGLPDDQIHAPNEHFGFDRVRKGFLTFARMLQLLQRG